MNSNRPDGGTDKPGMDNGRDRNGMRAMSTFTETFGLSRAAAICMMLLIAVGILASVFWFISSSPPRTITMTSGPPGSSFERVAKGYESILARNHVTLKILPSQGSIENLSRLADPKFQVDIGFVQAGESSTNKAEKLYSLGSIAYQPLLIFYRSSSPVKLLSDFAGKKLAIGPAGSGTRIIALQLLDTNGIVSGGDTELSDLDPEAAAKALLDGKIDAVFLMGDSASGVTMRSLIRAPGIQLFDFVQADAYTRKFNFLNKLQIPRGAIDFGKDIPPHDVNLIGPTVELIARANLHPALSDLLLDAARETNGNATMLQRKKEFPAQIEHDYKLSPDAVRYYTSGKKFLYGTLPFWLATLVNQVLTAIVPMLLLLIPGLRLIPTVYKWRVQLSIYRRYRKLLSVERDLHGEMTSAKRVELQKRLDEIEVSVNQMKVPASFAGQFYGLREHIGFVRDTIGEEPAAPS